MRVTSKNLTFELPLSNERRNPNPVEIYRVPIYLITVVMHGRWFLINNRLFGVAIKQASKEEQRRHAREMDAVIFRVHYARDKLSFPLCCPRIIPRARDIDSFAQTGCNIETNERFNCVSTTPVPRKGFRKSGSSARFPPLKTR